MEIQRIENAAGFDALRDEWDALLTESASDCVFLTWEWLRIWWNHLAEGRQLRVLTVRRGGELVALAPLAVRPCFVRRMFPFRVIDFLGCGTVGSDYLDLVVRRGVETETLEELSLSLGRSNRMLELSQLRGASSMAAALAGQLELRGWKSARTKINICPFIDLCGQTWTDYLAGLGSEHRYNVQRKLKNLSKRFEVAFEEVKDESQRGPALQLLISLHNRRWTGRGEGSDAFHTPGHLAFHEEFTAAALRRGWLRLYVLRLDGKPASALYGLRYGRTFYFYQSGFDPEYSRHSVGLVTMALAIKGAIEEGAEEYDLLHGDESYKFHWAKQSRDLERLELYPPGARGLYYRAMNSGERFGRRCARRLFRDGSGGASQSKSGSADRGTLEAPATEEPPAEDQIAVRTVSNQDRRKDSL